MKKCGRNRRTQWEATQVGASLKAELKAQRFHQILAALLYISYQLKGNDHLWIHAQSMAKERLISLLQSMVQEV